MTTDRAGDEQLDVPANITVIDDEQLENRHITDMEELVRREPGVTVRRGTNTTDPFNSFNGFTIRGVGGNRVAIQVDGSRMAEAIQDGTRDYVDLNFTKQAEIVRGPASVLWGADALGGLVAFETIDPEDLLQGRDRAVRVEGGYDSFDSNTNALLTFGQRFSDDLQLLVGVARDSGHEAELSNARDDGGSWGCPREVEAYGASTCGELDPTDISSTRALGKLVWTPDSQHRFEFTLDMLDRDTTVDQNSSLGPVLSSITGLPTGEIIENKERFLDQYRHRAAVEHTWAPAGGVITELKTTLSSSEHSYDRRGTELATSAAGDGIRERERLHFTENFLELDVQATAEFSTSAAEHRVIFGFDGDRAQTDYYRRVDTFNLTQGTDTTAVAGGFNFANATTTRADIYIEDRISFGDGAFELTPGLRFATYKIDPRPDGDYQEVAGSEPRVREHEALLKSLGALYRINENWSVWGKYGEGFKMPTAQQLYTSLPGSFFDLVPAPDLEPEQVKSYELGVRYEQPRGFVAVNAFKADYSNFIQSFYNPPGTNDYTYRNISVVNVWGIEASAGWAFNEATSMAVSAAWQKGTQQVSPGAEETPHTLPPIMATVSLAHEFAEPRLLLEGVLTMAGDVKETAGDNDFKPEGYAVLDLHANWEVVDNGFLRMSVNNVFDERYFTAGATNYAVSPSNAAIASASPRELQTGPGRTFAISFDMTF
ncbi:TonB-dependent receptor domain-containing protein [Vannielia sp. SX4]|uniref:TonB-dependent receptor domain-containing protein n=1 Tax=Vannielia sp. SX4 TaxID=3463852 RepID=UPI004059432D